MCGVIGIYSKSDIKYIHRCNNTKAHKEHDDHGTYCPEHLALGHWQLSILDLSEHGKQPISIDNGEIIIVLFKGEI